MSSQSRRAGAAAHERSFAAVTTFNEDGYERYARHMIDAFVRYWPAQATLYCFLESFRLPALAPNVRFLSLEDSCPSLVAFKERHRDNPRAHGAERRRIEPGPGGKPIGIGFRWNAVRYAHKVYTVTHAGRMLSEDVMFWMDADTVSFERVPTSFLDGLLPNDTYVCFLGRPHFTEAGFVGYNLRHEQNEAFMARYQEYYDRDLLFSEAEWHDCFIFDLVRREFEARGLIKSRDLSPPNLTTDHAFINSVLGNYMDHLKGKQRKKLGRSSAAQLEVPKDHPYWTGTR
jgi:hypothetical protein